MFFPLPPNTYQAAQFHIGITFRLISTTQKFHYGVEHFVHKITVKLNSFFRRKNIKTRLQKTKISMHTQR